MFRDFDTIVKNMGELPPSPIVASKLLELLRDPDLRIRDLANAVSLDPVISARLLKMANSVIYQQVKQVSSVDRALIVVGENVLKNLALEYSLRSTQKTYGLLERNLWENSVGCAVASRMIADRLTNLDKSEAYLAGLQRHIGKVVMINRHKKLYREVMRIVDSGEGSLRDVERGLFAYSHEMVGAALLHYWNYPKRIVDATLHHHHFEQIRDKDIETYRLCAVVSLGSCFCRYFGIGIKEPQKVDLTLCQGSLALEANPMIVDDLKELFFPEFLKERKLFLA